MSVPLSLCLYLGHSPLDRTAVLLQRYCGSVLLWQCLQLRQLFFFLMSTSLLATTMKTTTTTTTSLSSTSPSAVRSGAFICINTGCSSDPPLAAPFTCSIKKKKQLQTGSDFTTALICDWRSLLQLSPNRKSHSCHSVSLPVCLFKPGK